MMTGPLCSWKKPGYCPCLHLSLMCPLHTYPVCHRFWLILLLTYVSSLFAPLHLSCPGPVISPQLQSPQASPHMTAVVTLLQHGSDQSPSPFQTRLVSHLALDRTQTPYTHKILHGLLCLSSLISLSPLHSPAHGPVAPSGASRPLSRLSPATVVLFQAPCARFLLCGWHLLHLDVFQMTK